MRALFIELTAHYSEKVLTRIPSAHGLMKHLPDAMSVVAVSAAAA